MLITHRCKIHTFLVQYVPMLCIDSSVVLCIVLGRLLRKENCNGMYLIRTSLNAESGKVCVSMCLVLAYSKELIL